MVTLGLAHLRPLPKLAVMVKTKHFLQKRSTAPIAPPLLLLSTLTEAGPGYPERREKPRIIKLEKEYSAKMKRLAMLLQV